MCIVVRPATKRSIDAACQLIRTSVDCVNSLFVHYSPATRPHSFFIALYRYDFFFSGPGD